MLALFALGYLLPRASVAEIDALAKTRDIQGLVSHCAPSLKDPAAAFQFLRTGGAYGSGRFGWAVVPLKDASDQGDFVVFTTKITGEDLGAQVFRFDGAKMTEKVPELTTFGATITHHDFEVWFKPEAKSVRIVDKLTGSVSTESKSFQFRVSPHYIVDTIDDAGAAVPFTQAGGVVSVAAPADKQIDYTVTYAGIVDLPQFAASITEKEATLTNDFWWPQIARGPATYTAKVHGPKGWTAIGQGTQTKMEETLTERITSFDMKLPTSVFSLCCGPYKQAKKNIRGRTYIAWSINSSEEDLQKQADLNAPILDFYHRAYSPYPFSYWGTLESPAYGGGALEAYSFATYGSGSIATEDPHEPAHTWWGGIIPNTYLRSMWNESFAVFSEGYYGREGGPAEFDEKYRIERRQAFVSDGTPDGSYKNGTCATGSCETGGVASSLGYGKGSVVLQMLESELGEQKMGDSLRGWLHAHTAGTPGEWEEYEAVVSNVAGRDLKWFFDQWLRRPGWADFEVSNLAWAGGKLSGDVKFVGDPYRINCELMLSYADGSRVFTKFDTTQTKIGDGYHFEIPCAKKPSTASVDPWRKLLRRYGNDEAPTSLGRLLRSMPAYVEPGREAWGELGRRRTAERPAEVAGTVWIANPATDKAAKLLCERVGFKVNGNSLTYDGTTIDLRKGAAAAVVDLADGKQAVVAMGVVKHGLNPGRARLGVFDEYGRVLRAKTDPKTKGWGTFKL